MAAIAICISPFLLGAMLFALIVGLQPESVSAATISNTDIAYGESFEITGSGFGPPAVLSMICFGGDKTCSYSNAMAKLKGQHWTDTSIRSVLYSDIPIAGSLIVYVQTTEQSCVGSKCFTIPKEVERDRVSYRVVPTIKEVKTDMQFGVGGTLTISGHGFGDQRGGVSIGGIDLPISQWLYKEIKVDLPLSLNIQRGELIVKTTNGHDARTSISVAPPISSDEHSSLQTDYLEQISIPKAWQLQGGKEVVVAVIDDGVYVNHPDLAGHIWQNKKEIPGNSTDDDGNGYVDDYLGYNFVTNSGAMEPVGDHGTMIAGIIAGVRNNKIGIAGVASNVKIMPVIVFKKDGGAKLDAIRDAIRYAIDNGAEIINISAGTSGTQGYRDNDTAIYQYAFDRGVVVVVAGGNSEKLGGIGNNLNIVPESPACNTNKSRIMLSVAALDTMDTASAGKKKASFASYGSDCINISAPGVQIAGTAIPLFSKEKFYTQKDGSSFAAPLVAGVAALLKSKEPSLKNWEIINRLIATSDSVDASNPGFEGQVGGRVNAYRALTENSFIPSVTLMSPWTANTFDLITIRLKNYFSNQTFILTNEQGTEIIIPQEYIKVQAADKVLLTIAPIVPSGSYTLSLKEGDQTLGIYPDPLRITQVLSEVQSSAMDRGEEQKKEQEKSTPTPQPQNTILVSHDTFYELNAPEGISFGDARIPEVSYICFNDVNHCFDGATFHDLHGWSWGPKTINFQLFDHDPIDLSGNILIIQRDNPVCDTVGKCVPAETSKEIFRKSYKVVPSITAVKVPSIKKGAVITIEGNGFGKKKNRCMVDDDYVTVKKWGYKKVQCILPYTLKPGRHYFFITNSGTEVVAWGYDVSKPKKEAKK